jgi:uncharacterized protein YuzE
MMRESKARYDAKADMLYLVSDGGELARSSEASPGITVEFGDAGNILRVEILKAFKVFTEQGIASLYTKQAGVL